MTNAKRRTNIALLALKAMMHKLTEAQTIALTRAKRNLSEAMIDYQTAKENLIHAKTEHTTTKRLTYKLLVELQACKIDTLILFNDEYDNVVAMMDEIFAVELAGVNAAADIINQTLVEQFVKRMASQDANREKTKDILEIIKNRNNGFMFDEDLDEDKNDEQ